MMRAFVVLALLLGAPLAAAGSEARPEVTDGADVPRRSADILALWLEDDPRGVRFTFKLAEIPGPVPRQLYEIGFSIDGRGESVAVGWDRDGRLHSSVDTPNGWGAMPSRLDDALLDERAQLGAPAYVSAIIPWGAIDGLEPGSTLLGVGGRSTYYDESSSRWVLGYDEAGGGGLLGPRFTLAGGEGGLAWLTSAPILIGALGLCGAGAGWAIHLTRRRTP